MSADQSENPQSAEEHVRSLIALTESLSEIFASENDILIAQRPSDIAALQQDKARLAAAYAQSIRDAALNPGLVQSAQPALLSELRAITKTFEDRAERQRTLLQGAQNAAQGIIRAISDEANAVNNNNAAYTRPAHRERAASAAPISINESV